MPFPSFVALEGAATGDARRLLARGAEALRAGDPATAWLIADLLVRSRGGAEAMPYLLRASALARLGRPEESRRDLERAAFCAPYDLTVIDAVLATGPAQDREQAVRRLAGLSEADPDVALTARLAAAAKRAAVICAPSQEGVRLSGWAALPLSIELENEGEGGGRALSLAIDQPAGNGRPGFVGTAFAPWDAHDLARAFRAAGGDVLIHPATVLRPEMQASPSADPRDFSRSGRGLLVIVPVHDDFDATSACFRSLAENLPQDRPVRVIAIDDVTPDPRVAGLLDDLAASGAIRLVRNRLNLGFAASVNRGLKCRLPGEDVVLLNADTLVPPSALERLHDIALADPAIGTLTPLSNNGEDTSVPRRFTANALGSEAEVAELNALAWRANGDNTTVMPNGVGFCMLIAAPLLARQPLLPLAFGRGYYEDVAYCLAARGHGFSNRCASGVYVGHHGSRSFQSDRRWLVKRNLERLTGQFPGYRAEADAFLADDPLAEEAARLELFWLQDRRVVLVLAAAGAAARVGDARLRELSGSTAPMVIASVGQTGTVVLRGGEGGFPQNLTIDRRQPDDQALLHRLARACDALVLVDPDRLPGDLAAIGRQAANIAAAVLTSAPSGGYATPRWWVASRGAIHATSRRLADLWNRQDVAAQPPPATTPTTRPAVPVRSDALYLLSADDDDESAKLSAELGRIWPEQGGGISLVAVGANAPADKAAVAWLGPMTAGEFAEWFPLAGPGPVLLASRTFGCGDPRLDCWLAQGHPVAWFEAGLAEPRLDGCGLALPDDWPAEKVGHALSGWLDSLARSRAA